MMVSEHVYEDLTAITISNEPNKVKNMLEKLHFFPKEHIFVVDDSKKFSFLFELPRITVIETKSRNYAYLRNLGVSLASTFWVIKIDSDEYLDRRAILDLYSLNKQYNAYSLEKVAKFLDSYPHYLRRQFIAVHSREVCFYEGRIDEKVDRKKLKVGKLNGRLYNESYNTFETFKYKFGRYSSLHDKGFKNFFKKLFGEPYVYFQTNAFQDGIVGIKFLFYGLLFPFAIALNGIRSHKNISISDIELKLNEFSNSIDVRERSYIENMIIHLKNSKLTKRKLDENLEQLNSPFSQI